MVLTDLGTQMYTPATQLNISNPFACHLYTETNISVCFAFLDFYNQHGGTLQFGYPISPFEYHDGIIVQYFQRARMEWQPSNPESERVILTDLGSLYFDKLNEDPARKDPVQPLNASIQPRNYFASVAGFCMESGHCGKRPAIDIHHRKRSKRETYQ